MKLRLIKSFPEGSEIAKRQKMHKKRYNQIPSSNKSLGVYFGKLIPSKESSMSPNNQAGRKLMFSKRVLTN